MPFLGYIIMALLLWWIFFSGGNQKNRPSVPAAIKLVDSGDDLLKRLVECIEGGWSMASEQVEKGKWPEFGAALFLFLRNENFHSKRNRLSISEFFGKSAFEKDDLCYLARAAASKGLLKFDGNSLDLKDTPCLEELLKNNLFR